MYLNIDTDSEFLYDQIYSKIREKIFNNEIVHNEKIPSIRALAKDLNVSLNTVKHAYYQLEEEGYIESRQRAGFFCKKIDDLIVVDIEEEKEESNIATEKTMYDFSFSGVDAENFPYNIWRKMLKESVVEHDFSLLARVDFKGYLPLRQAIASYLTNSRDIETSAENIIISSGTESLFSLIKMMLSEDTLFAFENPGYAFGNKFFTHDLANPIPLSLDIDGVNIENVRDLTSCCIFVTPYQQFPMGTVMSIEKRIDLLNWASEERNRYIIEDDYEPEFKFKGYAIPSLKSIDKNDDVIYMGSFSKVIAPALRISYMVLPDRLVKLYEKKFSSLGCSVSTYVQNATSMFISQGHYEKHLNRMKVIYSKKYELMISLLKEIDSIKIISQGHSLTLVIELEDDLDDELFLEKLDSNGVKIRPLSRFLFRKKVISNRFVLGYAALTEKQIIDGMDIISKVVKDLKG